MSGLGNKDIMSKNLKYYIEKSGKDRRELSEIWGFPYSSVSEWVNGRKYPRIDKIEIMADYFGVKKSDLIEEKPTTQAGDELSKAKQKLIAKIMTLPEDKVTVLLSIAESIEQLYSEETPPADQE